MNEDIEIKSYLKDLYCPKCKNWELRQS
jgi:hypothetical protein